MIVEQYGLVYTRVREQDLELIRYWRNRPFIRDTMLFRDYITPAMQQAWFERINNKYNYDFVIEDRGKKIGLIDCKDTAPDTRLAEGGIFIWDRDYWGSPVAVFAALTMLECVFEIFRSGEASLATVSRENKRALQFNRSLSYTVLRDDPSEGFVKLMLTKERYEQHTGRMKRAANLYSGGKGIMRLIAEPSELLADEINNYLKR